jgi:hypothetical protein
MFVDCGAAPKAAEKLKVGSRVRLRTGKGLIRRQSDSTDDEFLLSRILFLLTYGSDANFEKLVNENQLGESINNVSCCFAAIYANLTSA